MSINIRDIANVGRRQDLNNLKPIRFDFARRKQQLKDTPTLKYIKYVIYETCLAIVVLLVSWCCIFLVLLSSEQLSTIVSKILGFPTSTLKSKRGAFKLK